MSDRTRSARRQQQDDEQDDDSSINRHGGIFADVLAHRVANQVHQVNQSADFRDQREELLDSFRASGFELKPETVQDIVNGVADALSKNTVPGLAVAVANKLGTAIVDKLYNTIVDKLCNTIVEKTPLSSKIPQPIA